MALVATTSIASADDDGDKPPDAAEMHDDMQERMMTDSRSMHRMHERMMTDSRGMRQMHERMTSNSSGMDQMHERTMSEGADLGGMMSGDGAGNRD
ncbi:MAG: hypothetical protein H0W24_02995 [Lysobacter sp.]|nr:hypothetical protein [Lysobacter sp.]